MQDIRIEKKNRRPNSSITNSVSTYVDNVNTMSKSTAHEYLSRLNNFKNFLADKYDNQLGIDVLLSNIKKGKEDPYNVLNGYAAYLRDHNVSAVTLKQRIVTVKNFFEYLY